MPSVAILLAQGSKTKMTYITCDIETAKQIASQQDVNQAVLLVGPHGVGKSEIVYQIAASLRDDVYKSKETCAAVGNILKNEGKMGDIVAENGGVWSYELGIPVIERRLSQMSEGELTGVPRIVENESLDRETTKFTQMDFMAITYKFPVVLFFDELNRAFPSLRQATFQIADSKIFLGNKLHPNTRVFVAANIGAMYQTDDFDVAEFSRYAVIGTQYDSEAWSRWASNRKDIHELVKSYILKEPTALYTDDKKFASNTKSPDPRAWTKVGRLMTRLSQENKLEEMVDSVSKFKMLVSSIIGPIEGFKFAEYCKENILFFGVKDIFENWKGVLSKIDKSTKHSDKKLKVIYELCHKVQASLDARNEIWLIENDEYARNLFDFFSNIPNELVVPIAQSTLKMRNDTEIKPKNSENSILSKFYNDVLRNRAKEVLSNDRKGIAS